jgi:hypothetical protein
MKLQVVRSAVGAMLSALGAGTLLLGMADVAHAVGPKADLAVKIMASKIAVDSDGKTFFVEVRNNGGGIAKKAKLAIDLSGLGSEVVADAPVDGNVCIGDAKKIVCDLGDLAPGYLDGTFGVHLKPLSSTIGPAGKLTASITSDTPESDKGNNTTSIKVELVGPSVDYGVIAANVTGLAPDVDTDLWIGVDNNGSKAGRGLALRVTLPKYVLFSEELTGCTYSKDRRSATCEWTSYVDADGNQRDLVLQPGQSVDPIALMIKVRVSPDAPLRANLGRAGVTVGALGEFVPEAGAVASTGSKPVRKATVRGKRIDGDKRDNAARFTLSTGDGKTDLEVRGVKASGKVGDTVKINIEVLNHGPWNSPAKAKLVVTAPRGSRFATAPGGCTAIAAGVKYECLLPAMVVGEAVQREFALTLLSTDVADGAAIVTGVLPDEVPDNNTGAIQVTVASALPTPGPTPSGGGRLPVTGASVGVLIVGGALGLGSGVLLLVLASRRRSF